MDKISEECAVVKKLPAYQDQCEMLNSDAQRMIACYIRSILEKHSAGESQSHLIRALKSLQDEFILSPLSSPKDSDQGMTVKLATKKMKVPFAIIKFSTVVTDDMIHEIAIGLVLNTIRDYTPNFMYTYAGFICSPPADLTTILQKRNYDEDPRMAYLNFPAKLKTLYLELIEDGVEDEEVTSKRVFLEYLPTFFMVMKNLRNKWLSTHNFRFIRSMKNECVEVLEESTQFRSVVRNKERDKQNLQEVLHDVEEMLDNILSAETFYSEVAEFFAMHEDDEIVESSRLCVDTEHEKALLVSEYFDNAVDLLTFSEAELSKKDLDNVILQVILSLVIANREIGFKHNDLHVGNILVQPLRGCSLRYKLGSRSITLKSNYIARIIDFGLSECFYKGSSVVPQNEMLEEKRSMTDFSMFRRQVTDLVSEEIADLLHIDDYDTLERNLQKYLERMLR